MRQRRLFWQVFPTFMVIAIASIVVIASLACVAFREFFIDRSKEDLLSRAQLVRVKIEQDFVNANFAQLRSQITRAGNEAETRITLIDASGKVLADSAENFDRMDDHGDRPEIIEALKGVPAYSNRYSDTVQGEYIYAAIPIRHQNEVVGVVRTSLPLQAIKRPLTRIYIQVFSVSLFLVFALGLTSWWISKRISRPLEVMKAQADRISQGDFSGRVRISLSDPLEILELAKSMNDNARQLHKRIETILTQKNEQEAVFSSMSEGVLAVDLDQKVKTLNQSAAQILGVKKNEAKDKLIEEVVLMPELRDFILDSLEKETTTEKELELERRGDSDKRILQVHGSPLRSATEERIGVVLVLSDITNLRRLENYRREFVANVSHELRTPLTSIQGFAETLMNPHVTDEKERARFLQIIHRHACRLGEIFEDLLALSRIERETEQHLVELNFASVRGPISSAIELCEMKAKQRGIQISALGHLDIKAKINGPLLEQALTNLIDNAIKYSDQAGKIDISVAERDKEICISVRDYGAGISKEHLPRLFERFYRVDKARSRKMGGTGLGLSIVKHVSIAHKGRLDVESEIGKGTRFTLILPNPNQNIDTLTGSREAVIRTTIS